jgi:hypothetical protein
MTTISITHGYRVNTLFTTTLPQCHITWRWTRRGSVRVCRGLKMRNGGSSASRAPGMWFFIYFTIHTTITTRQPRICHVNASKWTCWCVPHHHTITTVISRLQGPHSVATSPNDDDWGPRQISGPFFYIYFVLRHPMMMNNVSFSFFFIYCTNYYFLSYTSGLKRNNSKLSFGYLDNRKITTPLPPLRPPLSCHITSRESDRHFATSPLNNDKWWEVDRARDEH